MRSERNIVSEYSGGMRQRFGIAQMLLNNPNLIIVDEPTAGLDPTERQRFLNVLREIGTQNTVIFSTHIVEDVKELCHELAIMNHGQILRKAFPLEAIRTIEGKIWTKAIHRDELVTFEAQFEVLSSKYNHDNSINIRVFSAQKPEGFKTTKAQLEDVYFWELGKH